MSAMFAYARPQSLAETFALLETQPAARLLAGGTDLLVGVRKGTVVAPMLVDLKRVAELQGGITEHDGALRIGAGTVLTDVIEDRRVQTAFPALVAAARVVGSIQIRNRATLAGNLCNASPAADSVPALLVVGAIVELTGPDGPRRMPLADFIVGPGRTVLGPGELVTAVELPMPVDPVGSAFQRMTRRRGVDLATVNLACAVTSIGVTRFAFGAVGPRAFLLADETGILASGTADPAQEDAIIRGMTAQATPISNVRASREYREAMLLVLSRRALRAARERLAEARRGR
jgi:CO/xanthine dehydrogenase FAD-binding subunit